VDQIEKTKDEELHRPYIIPLPRYLGINLNKGGKRIEKWTKEVPVTGDKK
jgi:hypothetical protein